jgi:putative SOS response-associated peptidase YedK
MCGRFTLASPAETVAELFELDGIPTLMPRYNIAPAQPVPVVLMTPERPTRRLVKLRWGLIPSWARDASIGARMINARAESVASKPSFRAAFRRRRCLVVADGFYEWQKLQHRKQPFYVHLRNGRPFALAGLWERWEGADGGAIDSCTIITTEPNELMAPLHNRMPAILQPGDYALWLDPRTQTPEAVQPLLRPFPCQEMSAYAVSTQVNKPTMDSPTCIAPLP